MDKMTFEVKIRYSVTCKDKYEGLATVTKIMQMLGLQNFKIEQVRKKRSDSQNSALWLYLGQVEAHCQERGLTVESLFKRPTEIPVTKNILHMWIVELVKYMLGKDGTSKLDTKEFSAIVDKTQDEFATRLDYNEPFPSIQSQMERDNY